MNRTQLNKIIISIAALIAAILAGAEVFNTAWGSGFFLGRLSLKWALSFGGIALLLTGLVLLTLLALWKPIHLTEINKSWLRLRARLGKTRWLLLALFAGFPAWLLLYSPWGDVFTGFFTRLILLLIACAFAAALLTTSENLIIDWGMLLVGSLITGSLFALSKYFVTVTSYPFSLSWSEGNRLYDYSLLYGRHLYNYPVDQPLESNLGNSRVSLWGLPYLFIAQPSIGLMRFWDALVSTFPMILLGWFLVRREKGERWGWFFFGLWTFLFLNQGPIYTPLVLAAILVAAALRAPYKFSLPLIILAGLYTFKSRLSWMFAPAMWSGMAALVQVKAIQFKDWLRAGLFSAAGLFGAIVVSMVFPILIPRLIQFWTAPTSDDAAINEGTLIARAASVATEDVVELSENIATQQTLLWSRLLPNASNGLGVLLGLLMACLPLIILLVYLIRARKWLLSPLQVLALCGVQTAFLAVGLFASVKVGGGLDLHNLDMFLVGMVFITALAWQAGLGHSLLGSIRSEPFIRSLVLLAVLIPSFVPMIDARPLQLPPDEKIEVALDTIRHTINCAQQHGDVLFMDQRQLLTFGFVEDVPLVPAYEKKWVMDQALSHNQVFFEDFKKDLASGAYSLIITERQAILQKTDNDALAYENNAWVEYVTVPMLDNYETVANYKLVKVELFLPIDRDFECPLP